MGNKNKQIQEVINEIELSEAELLEIEFLQPPNMLIKISLSKDLKFLSNEDKAAIFTNMFNYHTGTELVAMSDIAEMFFSRVVEVFEYNIYNYQDVVKKNRKNGRKGGRPIKKTQNNPTVISENPNNLKDRDIVNVNVKGIDIPNATDITNSNATDITNSNATEITKPNATTIGTAETKQYQEKFRKVIDIDFRNIPDLESKHFCYDVIDLNEKLGWSRFDVLIFGTSKKEVPAVLAEYNFPELEAGVIGIKRSYNFFLNKLIN
jgi:hypothetical protein